MPQVKLYWKEGEFFQDVDGVVTQLSPWVGVALEHQKEVGVDYTRREGLTKYTPNDLSNYLKRNRNGNI